MHIREATPSDFISIQGLANQIWPYTYGTILSPDQLSYMLDLFYTPEALLQQQTNGQHFFLLHEGSTPIGFASLEFNASPYQAKLHKLYVLTALQKRGYGQFFLKYCMKLAKEAQQTHLCLNVNRFNTAIQFYLKMGFQIEAAIDIEIDSGYLMEDYSMVIGL